MLERVAWGVLALIHLSPTAALAQATPPPDPTFFSMPDKYSYVAPQSTDTHSWSCGGSAESRVEIRRTQSSADNKASFSLELLTAKFRGNDLDARQRDDLENAIQSLSTIISLSGRCRSNVDEIFIRGSIYSDGKWMEKKFTFTFGP